jgi:hypothetical protein
MISVVMNTVDDGIISGSTTIAITQPPYITLGTIEASKAKNWIAYD